MLFGGTNMLALLQGNIYLGQHPNLSVTALGLEPRVKIHGGVIGPGESKTSVTVTDNSCINWLHTFFHFLSNLISLWSSVYKQAQNGNFLMLVRIKCVFSVKLIEHLGPCQWALSEQHHYSESCGRGWQDGPKAHMIGGEKLILRVVL